MSRAYDDADQVTAMFTQLFARIRQADARALDAVVKRRMVVRFRIREPDVEVWVDGRRAPVSVSFGPADLKTTLDLDLTADSLHELLLGTLPLGRAMSSRRVRVKGSKLKAMQLQGLFHAFQAVYPGLAADLLGGGQ